MMNKNIINKITNFEEITLEKMMEGYSQCHLLKR